MVNKCNLIYNSARCLRKQNIELNLSGCFWRGAWTKTPRSKRTNEREEEWTCHRAVDRCAAFQMCIRFIFWRQKPEAVHTTPGAGAATRRIWNVPSINDFINVFFFMRQLFQYQQFLFLFPFLFPRQSIRSAMRSHYFDKRIVHNAYFIPHAYTRMFIATANVCLMRTTAAAATAITSIYTFESKCLFCRWFIASAARGAFRFWCNVCASERPGNVFNNK